LGATPVFADCCPVCFGLGIDDLEKRVTSRTRAIIPVHLFGQSAAMDEIMAFASRHELKVVEDAAQSQGARYKGTPVAAIGDVGVFSFFPTKNLGAFGDAGMLVTSNGDLAERARTLRNHGMQPKYHHAVVGGNFRLDALQAAILRVKFRHLAAYTEGRRRNAEFYLKGLSSLPGAEAPEGAACGESGEGSAPLGLPTIHPGNDSTWNQFTLRIRGEGRRDALKRHLDDRGIGSEIYYPVPLHRQECFRKFVPGEPALPRSEAAGDEVLSLPIYPELSDDAKDVVIEAIGEFLEKN